MSERQFDKYTLPEKQIEESDLNVDDTEVISFFGAKFGFVWGVFMLLLFALSLIVSLFVYLSVVNAAG